MKLNIPDYIMSIDPYEPGKPVDFLEQKYGIKKSIKLASNENPVGTSPMAAKAIIEHLPAMNRYPDGSALKLTLKLAERFHIKTENVIVGNGSDDIIALLAHAFLGCGRKALMPLPSFLMYEISVKASGGIPVMIPLKGLSIDLDALADAVTEKVAMIFLTNPNNPTGSFFTKDEFTAFMAKLPEDILVIVDEAYIEFARDQEIYNSLEYIKHTEHTEHIEHTEHNEHIERAEHNEHIERAEHNEHIEHAEQNKHIEHIKYPLTDSRVISLRTFSKAYGLAGFRVGYGIMDASITAVLHRIRQPFNVNSLAQVAAAAALDDHDFLKTGIRIMHQGIDDLRDELSEMDIITFPTQANFFLMDVKQDATDLFNTLLKHGIISRSMKSYGFPTYLRISAGLPEENSAFLSVLKKIL